ncbi:MAG TPA: hypothetical protein VLF67_05470 [Candidatus Saccharimonas sp.]|nr:hypothetical protein [Candidatus Saccharimonas sp.]
MLSRLFNRHPIPQAQFAPGLFLVLIIIFGLVAQIRPVFGLACLGTTSILAAALIELNRVRIWEMYRKAYKKHKAFHSPWHEPRDTYYRINVVILWPLVAALGALCLWAAYELS